MEMAEFIVQIISTVGFPIVVSSYLLYQNKYEADKHENEIAGLKETLENNTIAITKLCMTIEHSRKDND